MQEYRLKRMSTHHIAHTVVQLTATVRCQPTVKNIETFTTKFKEADGHDTKRGIQNQEAAIKVTCNEVWWRLTLFTSSGSSSLNVRNWISHDLVKGLYMSQTSPSTRASTDFLQCHSLKSEESEKHVTWFLVLLFRVNKLFPCICNNNLQVFYHCKWLRRISCR